MKICTKCQQPKAFEQFRRDAKGAGGYAARCRVCVSGALGPKQRWVHGASGYQNHGCRCDTCKTQWATLQRQRYAARKGKPAVEPVLTSWWIDAPREGLTALAEQAHVPRMRVSTIGYGRGRAISSEELNR